MTTRYPLFATAPKYMEELLAHELAGLGAQSIKQTVGGVYFKGDLSVAYRACLWSRIANRILLPLSQFTATDASELYEGTQEIRWSDHFSVNNTFVIDCVTSNSALTHSQFCAQKIKDAIADQFTDSEGERPSVDRDNPDIRINCYLKNDKASISIDLSGDSLHRRGYRTDGEAAPLKENLAAAILHRSNWPEIASEGGSFIDPLCGSGTLAIEAALMAGDIAPGLLRTHFGFRAWRQHNIWIWENLLDEARKRRDEGLDKLPLILGYDKSDRVVDSARANAKRAGLDQHVVFSVCAVENLICPKIARTGLVLANPPYGERLGRDDNLPALYRQIGDTLKSQFPQWRAAILTSDPALGKSTGIRAHRIHKLLNGTIECQLLHFNIDEEWFMKYRNDDNADLTPAVTSAASLAASPGAEMFANRLRKNLKQLGRWADKQHIRCYRLYDADMPEYALAVDIYGGDETWVHVQEYAAPASIDEHSAWTRLNEALSVLPVVLGVDEKNIYLKTRQIQKGSQQYTRQANQQRLVEVEENDLRFQVNFSDYLDTGLFLDHRPTRELIKQLAKDQHFLNLFCYTGTVSVYAAAGGASSTTSIDMSNTYLEWAKRNFSINHIALDSHEFLQADCLAWLKQERSQQYGLVFLDPPTFSNSKRMSDNFDVQKDHESLIRQTMRCLEQDGTLIFSNNFRKFKMSQVIRDSYEVSDISAQSIPKDYQRNPRVHNCWQIRHRQNVPRSPWSR